MRGKNKVLDIFSLKTTIVIAFIGILASLATISSAICQLNKLVAVIAYELVRFKPNK